MLCIGRLISFNIYQGLRVHLDNTMKLIQPYLVGTCSCTELTKTIPMGLENRNHSKEIKAYLKVTIMCSGMRKP
jgi:hypothetical protein